MGIMRLSSLPIVCTLLQIALLLYFASLTTGQIMKCMNQCEPRDNSTYPSCQSCNQFIKCMYGKTEKLTCPFGLLWDVRMMTCNYPEKSTCSCAECGNPPVRLIRPPVKPGLPTPSPKNRPPPNQSPECGVSFCSGLGTSYQPHCSDCTKFIRCENNRNVRWLICPRNYYFDAISRRCKPPEKATCRSFGQNAKPPATTNNGLECGVSFCSGLGTSYQPHCSDCTKFIRCENNRNMGSLICPQNLHFDAISRRCKPPEMATCRSFGQNAKPPATTNNGLECGVSFCSGLGTSYQPHCSDCTKFIRCENNRNMGSLICPQNFHFDAISRRCKPPEMATCRSFGQNAKPPATTNNGPECGVSFCSGLGTSYQPHCSDCTKFIRCENNQNMGSLICPQNLHFDAIKRRCMPPETAMCRSFGQNAKPPATNVFDCPSLMCQGHGTSYRPHCVDCHRYAKCFNDVLVGIYSCSYDYMFDIYESRCKPPSTAICITEQKDTKYPPRRTITYPPRRTITYPPRRTITYPPRRTITYPPRKTTTNPPLKITTPETPYPNKPSECPDEICEGDGSPYRPHCSDCRKLVKCYNNRITNIIQCPFRHEFDINELRCMPADKAVCKTRTPQTTPIKVANTPKPPSSRRCMRNVNECNNKPDAKYANCDDCTTFIECYRNNGFAMHCPQSARWDPTQNNCKYNIPCWNADGFVTQEPIITKENPTTRAPTTTTKTQPTTEKTCESSCAGIPDGVYAKCPDGSQFLMCSYPRETVYNCPVNKYFNYHTQTCG